MSKELLVVRLNEKLLENAQAFRRAGIKVPTIREKIKTSEGSYKDAERWLDEFVIQYVKPFQKTLNIYESFVTWDILLTDPLSKTNRECIKYVNQRKLLRLAWVQRPGVFKNASGLKKNRATGNRKVSEPGRPKN